MISITTHSGEGAEGLDGDVLSIWNEAFGPVADPREWRSFVWDRHRARDGYRLVTARDDERMLGFAWGYTGERGQYWSDHVSREVGSALDEWIGGHFEFVELAVRPDAQRRGIGLQLHDALISDLPHARALLSTSGDADDAGVRLYESAGWVTLGFYGDERRVMGLAFPDAARFRRSDEPQP
ncbi:GNAT family N-acetyltransferase [Microbacterium sp. NPDC089320]|uniref:GNAT family N-acetyltransferase n=1 Tax=Microbacterium sp. NPDC089320 TaxID=3155182 RepID=UPI003437E877